MTMQGATFKVEVAVEKPMRAEALAELNDKGTMFVGVEVDVASELGRMVLAGESPDALAPKLQQTIADVLGLLLGEVQRTQKEQAAKKDSGGNGTIRTLVGGLAR